MTSMSKESLESFINDFLKEDLKELENHLNLRNQEIMEFIQLKNTISVIQSDLAGKSRNIRCNAEAPIKTSTF